MTKNVIVLFFLYFFVTHLNGQNLVESSVSGLKSNNDSSLFLVKDFPTGGYRTFEDFIQKKVIYMGDAVDTRSIVGFEKKPIPKDSIVDHVFFYIKQNNTKITHHFAIVYNGNLYIQQKYIHQFASKKDKNQDGDNPNSYHRVLNDGKFFYLEVAFANVWSKGFAYGSGGAVGGTIGSSLNKLKGIIFDMNKKEFVFMRNCEDLNLLLEKYNSPKINCEDKKIDILLVRENINRIIK